MALLKDSLVQGSLRVTDELYNDVAYLKTIYAGTSSSDSTPSVGTSGQVLKSNGNSVYWDNDNNSVTGVKGNFESSYRTGQVNITKGNIGLGNVENTALSTWTGSTSIATLGTITAGTWNGTVIAAGYIGNLPANKITSGKFDFDRLPDLYWANVAISDSSSTTTTPTVQSITAGTMTIGGSNTPNSYTINSNDTLELKSKSGTSIIFASNGTAQGRFDASGYFRPETTNTSSLGTSSYVWGNLYSKIANITNNIVITTTGYGLTLKDSAGKAYQGIWDNGTNLWIGATSSTGQHHKGSTFISAGHNGSAGNQSVYISIPNTTDGETFSTHTSYKIAYLTSVTSGQVMVADGTAGGIKTTGYTLADALWNTRGTLIPDNTDLNSYNQTDNGLGNYYSPDSSTSGSLDNSPTANSGFRLISLQGYQSTRGYQIALGAPVTPWVRTETGTARNYTDWAKILYKTGSSAIGGNSQPVFIDSNGKAAAITSVNVAHGGTGATTAADARTNLLAATGNGRIFYGTCTTAGGTAAKAVTCASYDALTVGDVVIVDFSNTNSAAVADLTLNVNNKGAKNIKKHYNSTAANNLNAAGVLTNSIHTFVYDGNYWILIDSDYNSSYSAMSVAEMRTGTATSSRVMTAKNLNDFLDSYGLNASNITSGTLAIARGGTNKTSWDINKLVYASATNVLGQLGHASSTSYLLKSGSSSTAPSWIQYTNANTASTIVQRDSSGNFSAGTITATLSGNATTATTASHLNSSTGTTLVGLAGFDISNTTSVYRSQYFQISGTSFYGSSTADVSSTTNNAETKIYLSASSGTISTRGDIQGITSGSLATGTKGWSISNTGIVQCSSISSTGQIQGQNLIAIKRDSNANGGVIQLNPPGSTSTVYIDYWIDEADSNHPYLRFIYGTTLVARIDLAKTTTITLN